MSSARHYGLIDHAIGQFDSMLLLLGRTNVNPSRASPAQGYPHTTLSDELRTHSQRCMRHNQFDQALSVALYRGRSLAAITSEQRAQLAAQAMLGFDRLLWCRARLEELGGQPSHLLPLAYLTGIGVGAVAQRMGQARAESLAGAQAYAANKRLARQLEQLRNQDPRSHAVVARLSEQENQRAYAALEKGRHELTLPLRLGARLTDRLLAQLIKRV